MNETYVLDACSLISLLTNEEGSSAIEKLLERAINGEIKVLMHKVNFLEVYYYTYKKYGEGTALKLLGDLKISPIKIDAEITNDIIIRAGRLKSSYKMSLADSIGLAESIINDGYFVTSDHHEIEPVEKKEKIKVFWFR